jgi:protein SCO1/2
VRTEAVATAEPLRGGGKIFLLYGVCVAITLFVLGTAWLQMRYQQPPLQKFRTLPDFQLTDQDGHPFGLADLKGKVWLADFVYTTCPGPCPAVTRGMSQLQGEALKNADVRLVTFTMDPKDETPRPC